MNKKLSRRDFLKLAGVASASLALTSCGVKSVVFSTPTSTVKPIPTNTVPPAPSSTPVPSPESILPIDKIKETNSHFLQLTNAFKGFPNKIKLDKIIIEKASSGLLDWISAAIFAYKGIAQLDISVNEFGHNLTVEIVQNYMRQYPSIFIRNIQETKTQGKMQVIVLPVIYQDDNGEEVRSIIPLAIKDESGLFVECTIGRLCEIIGITPDVMYGPPNMWADEDTAIDFITWMKNLQKIAKGGELSVGVDIKDLYRDFTKEDWIIVLSKWDTIKQTLDKGIMPNDESTKKIDFGVPDFYLEKQMPVITPKKIRIMGLVNNSIQLDSLEKGGFSTDELIKIFEYTIKTRVIHFSQRDKNGIISTWSVGEEMLMANFATDRPDLHFWLNIYNRDPIALYEDVSKWVREIVGNDIEICISEPQMTDFNNKWLGDKLPRYFMDFLGKLQLANQKAGKRIIDGFDFEQNEWIGRPPVWDKVKQMLSEVVAKGYKVFGPETVVSKANEHPGSLGEFLSQEKKQLFADENIREIEQAHIFVEIAKIYKELGVNRIGFGSINDKYAWMQFNGGDYGSSVFGYDGEPNLAYFTLMSYLLNHAI